MCLISFKVRRLTPFRTRDESFHEWPKDLDSHESGKSRTRITTTAVRGKGLNGLALRSLIPVSPAIPALSTNGLSH
jgi:hypothetical protein